MIERLLDQFSDLPLAFGGAAISGEGRGYGFGEISEDKAIGLLHEAFDLGIKVYDSAPIYGFGLSEQRMGKAFKSNREKVFITSKSGVTWHPNKRVDMSNDPKITQKMLEQSLRDLESDYIDLYMIHWPDKKVDIRRPMEILAKAKEQGKIHHIGLCNTFSEDLVKAQEIEKIEVVQSELNLFQRGVLELLPFLESEKISFMSWGTFDKGIITGRAKKDRQYEASDARSWAPWWKKSNYKEKIELMEKCRPFLVKKGLNGSALALGHNFETAKNSMAICGFRNSEQLRDGLKSYQQRASFEVVGEFLRMISGE